MIRYDLVCDREHRFDAWFSGSDGFDDQRAQGLVSCPHCGSAKVSKAVMAPSVAKGASPGPSDAAPDLSDAMRKALRDLRSRMTEGSEDVGVRFAAEARRMHRGEIPHRSVHGAANPREVRELVEEGVPVAPLPAEPRGH